MEKENPYTCAEYREEMMLLGLKMCLQDPNLSEAEKQVIHREIAKLETVMNIN